LKGLEGGLRADGTKEPERGTGDPATTDFPLAHHCVSLLFFLSASLRKLNTGEDKKELLQIQVHGILPRINNGTK
jgi:hypothetical protein